MTLRFLLWIKAFILLFASTVAISKQTIQTNLWDSLSQQFVLNHDVQRKEVQHQIQWILKHPTYLKQLTTQATPYLYYVVNEVHKQNLPGELALLPMIESAYDPFAYSSVGAAGIWQMMPSTGKNLGLKQSWWADNRRSIPQSTHAALSYLRYLNKFFHGNWTLALAAYDSGEGKLARAIKKSHNNNFWGLPLPHETRGYIPRLMAIAEIIENPQRYHVHLPDIPNAPYFTEVRIDGHLDLTTAANLADISYQELIRLNPEHNRWTTSPFKQLSLLMPVKHADKFYKNYLRLPADKRNSLSEHIVSETESMESLINQYQTTKKLLMEINELESEKLSSGQLIFVPTSALVKENSPTEQVKNQVSAKVNSTVIPPDKYRILHIVDDGDTYKHIARKYHVSEDEIRQWNNLEKGQKLQPAKQLVIWREEVLPSSYRVKQGDTLSRIAINHKTTVRKLMKLNPSLKDDRLRYGQKIRTN